LAPQSGDQATAYVHLDTFNAELNQIGRAGVVEIRSSVTAAGQEILAKELRDFLDAKGLKVGFTDTAARDQEQANAQFGILTTLLMIMTFLMAVVGSFGLSGTLSINVLERRREIGVMRAVGASSGDVAYVFMSEGLLLGILSWAQAVPLSMLGAQFFVDALSTALNFPFFYRYSYSGMWMWLGIILALSVVASWVPAHRATQISVQESLAYE